MHAKLKPAHLHQEVPVMQTTISDIFGQRAAMGNGRFKHQRTLPPLDETTRYDSEKRKSTMVPRAGIEPALLSEPDFESGASTNSANGASKVVAGDLAQPHLPAQALLAGLK